jgi:hypothetical protein
MTSSPSPNGDGQPETFIVSSSILDSWSSRNFPNVASIKALVFEAGVELREIPSYFFDGFNSLQSICIPASVEVIQRDAFVDAFEDFSCVQTLTFEAGSKLQRIEKLAFSGCASLKSICLPASVTEIGGGAFCDSGIREISIEDGNRHFVVF